MIFHKNIIRPHVDILCCCSDLKSPIFVQGFNKQKASQENTNKMNDFNLAIVMCQLGAVGLSGKYLDACFCRVQSI